MNNDKTSNKIVAAVLGAYAGTILATGIFVIFGGDLNTGDWWGWIGYSLIWSTVISMPLSLILMFSLVKIVFKFLPHHNTHKLRLYALVGFISGTLPIVTIYVATLIYFFASNANLNEYASTLIPFFYFLMYGALCGVISLVILLKISYNKSLNLTGADNAPSS